jgi:carbonic anhydrase
VASMLPVNQNYYMFAGSLTTPPCSEGVTWYVLQSPVQVSAAQVAAFGKFFPMNARPIQPTNSRQILESAFKK